MTTPTGPLGLIHHSQGKEIPSEGVSRERNVQTVHDPGATVGKKILGRKKRTDSVQKPVTATEERENKSERCKGSKNVLDPVPPRPDPEKARGEKQYRALLYGIPDLQSEDKTGEVLLVAGKWRAPGSLVGRERSGVEESRQGARA